MIKAEHSPSGQGIAWPRLRELAQGLIQKTESSADSKIQQERRKLKDVLDELSDLHGHDIRTAAESFARLWDAVSSFAENVQPTNSVIAEEALEGLRNTQRALGLQPPIG